MQNFIARFETADGEFTITIPAASLNAALARWHNIKLPHWFLDSIGPEFKMEWPDWA
jgi:hypothetical protein